MRRNAESSANTKRGCANRKNVRADVRGKITERDGVRPQSGELRRGSSYYATTPYQALRGQERKVIHIYIIVIELL